MSTTNRGRFKRAGQERTVRRSLFWSGQGTGGSGKTHFLLTAPEPIAVFLFNDRQGVDAILDNHEDLRRKDISVVNVDFNPGGLAFTDRPKAANDALAQFKSDYANVLTWARTCGWDKEDKVWELLRYALLENYTDRPSSYYELNLIYADWFADAEEAGVNLGLIRGMKEKWGQNEKGSPSGTGNYIARGQKEVNEAVQIVLHHYWDDGFKVRIGGQEGDDPKCRVGDATTLIGMVEDNLDFATLQALVYPDVDPAEFGL